MCCEPTIIYLLHEQLSLGRKAKDIGSVARQAAADSALGALLLLPLPPPHAGPLTSLETVADELRVPWLSIQAGPRNEKILT